MHFAHENKGMSSKMEILVRKQVEKFRKLLMQRHQPKIYFLKTFPKKTLRVQKKTKKKKKKNKLKKISQSKQNQTAKKKLQL